MKNLILIFFIFCNALAGSLMSVQAQVHTNTEVSASAMLSIDVVVPISARESQSLNFGRFYPGTNGGTISISPGGFVNTSNGVLITASAPSAGVFTISGQGDATYAINLPPGPITITNSDGTRTMVVGGWVSDPVNGDANMRLQGGAQTVRLGATLRMGSLNENPKGVYTGSYEITFGYN